MTKIMASFIAAGGLLLSLVLSRAAAADEWSTDDLLATEKIVRFVVSPTDAQTVIWEKSAPDKEKNEYISHLFRGGPASGTEAVQLTRGKDSCTHPRFSPDGKRIAFLSARPLPKSKGKAGDDSDEDKPKSQIWLLEHGEPYPLTELDRAVKDFGWRDANHIVFIAQESPAERERELKEKKDTSAVVEDEANEPPVRLFEVELKSKKVTRLSTNADRISELFVAPDGRHVVTFHSQSLRFEYDNAIRPQYFLTDLRSGEQKRIFADRRFNLLAIEWSPDSREFFAANRFTTHPKYLCATVTECWRFDVEDTRETQVPLDWPNGLASEVMNYASGDYLSTTADGFVTLLAAGARVKAARFTREGQTWTRTWLEGTLASNLFALKITPVAGTNHLHFIRTTASTPPQLFAAKLDGARIADPTAITTLNEGWKDKAKARVEIVRWKGARNEEVEGLLHYPHDYKSGQRRPLVLMIHGGPCAADLDAWGDRCSYPIQLHCQRGAFVLRVNYHGSANYGLEFASSITGEDNYYKLPVTDLERGVDALIERGLVDPDRIGTLGWSNGAILTLALLTHNPTRYRAAASGAGGFEWVADTSVTSFGQAFNDYYFGAMPWQNPAVYTANAPYYQADRIRTPLIIFHGDADTSVPIHHGWMQFRALQQRTKTPVRFVTFPGEEHGLKKLSHMKRKIDEELAWFDRYLYGTAKPPEPWLKEGSPLAALAARTKAKSDNGRLGVLVNGRLVPEVARFKGVQVGRFEVTRAQFGQCEAGYPVPAGRENFPASGVTFEQARKYCEWLCQLTGEKWRLPNVDEAEKLYEAGDAEENTLDHWAGYAPNPEDAAELRASVAPAGAGALLESVGRFASAGKEPVFDLGGNVAEWTTDKDGKPVLSGGSADQPKEPRTRKPQVDPEYIGFRVVRE
ncbi:MAG: prolyl oligopeptidase family serine peptidase [Planctomycetes bacterium]|nr:prolyl oligopeptidase family serine peptidase [Planctomycetota bacterium]